MSDLSIIPHRESYYREFRKTYESQDKFGATEIGYTQPDTEAYIRLNDAGDIEVVAKSGCAVIISASGDITFVADEVNIITKPGNSIRWNSFELNASASVYSQPSLVMSKVMDRHYLYAGVSEFSNV